MEKVGERLKRIRKENNYTQDMLAAKLNLEPAAISKYETNRVPIPQEYIIKICDLFNISTDYLLGRTDEALLNVQKRMKDNNIKAYTFSDIDLDKYSELDEDKKKLIAKQMNAMIDIFLEEKDK